MFEKSKSSITFKEFQDKLNIINAFESDWGHFYDTDYIDTNTSANANVNKNKNNLYYPKKVLRAKKNFIDLENQEEKKNITSKKEYSYNYEEDEKVISFVKTVCNYFQVITITITMGYFIFKII
jgi:hypothetical protein